MLSGHICHVILLYLGFAKLKRLWLDKKSASMYT